MKKSEFIGLTIVCGISAVAVFHMCHYMLYCRYKGDPEKSHCAVCGHHKICQKYHHGNSQSNG